MERKKQKSTRANMSQKSSHSICVKRLLDVYFTAYAGVVAYILLARRNSDGGNTYRKGQEKQHHDEELEDQEKRKALENQLDA